MTPPAPAETHPDALPPLPATAPPSRGPRRTFAALEVPNFRTYAVGQAFANTGVWLQNIALDWLVLQLTGSATAVGITMACQFLPIMLLGMHGGALADRLPKRRVLMLTQVLNAGLAATLAVLTLSGAITPTLIYLLALAAGTVLALDNPTRQAFVGEVVPAEHLRNAVALNAAVFQSTRLVGPALAGVLIATAGTGYAFAINAVLMLVPVITLSLMRVEELLPAARVEHAERKVSAALRHIAERPHVARTIVLVGVFGTFGLNFPVVLTAMAADTFGGDASLYGFFNLVLAVGSILGALLAGSRQHTRVRLILALAAVFGLSQTLAAFAPGVAWFCVALLVMGVSNLAFQAMANSSVQLWVEPPYRGRVMGLYMLVFMGGTPIGAPLVGWAVEEFGVRAGMAACGAIPLAVALGLGVVLTVRALRDARPAAPELVAA
ncbi:MFS transporter [Kineococcus gynurae]|uniref:MFS transporter n=1 Tax=Kineococcus gynurae TaxID=452979 RepID=A0ABV5LQU2_9ACTN